MSAAATASATTSDSAQTPLRVAVYSDDRTVRAQVRQAVGRRVARDLPELELIEFATPAALVASFDVEVYDLAILDGEAVPLGGMGLAHQLKDEIPTVPPIIVLVARPDDAWLASWSRAEAISSYPIDPLRLPETVAEVLRAARAGEATELAPEPAPEPGVSSRHEPE